VVRLPQAGRLILRDLYVQVLLAILGTNFGVHAMWWQPELTDLLMQHATCSVSGVLFEGRPYTLLTAKYVFALFCASGARDFGAHAVTAGTTAIAFLCVAACAANFAFAAAATATRVFCTSVSTCLRCGPLGAACWMTLSTSTSGFLLSCWCVVFIAVGVRVRAFPLRARLQRPSPIGFVALYTVAGLAGSALDVAVNDAWFQLFSASLGASGAVMGVLTYSFLGDKRDVAAEILFVHLSGRAANALLLAVNGAGTAYMLMYGVHALGVSWAAHLGGMAVGALAYAGQRAWVRGALAAH
jgi:membrane associated rhomboid family serine protease